MSDIRFHNAWVSEVYIIIYTKGEKTIRQILHDT